VNHATYSIRKIKKKSEYEYVTCRFCSKNKDTYQHRKTDCSNKKVKNIFKEEYTLLSSLNLLSNYERKQCAWDIRYSSYVRVHRLKIAANCKKV
jgi:hypothetical protein